MLTNLNALIIGSLLLFVTPIMASAANAESELITGPQVARVIVPRAIVYSDESMNSPLGYISNDKLITVGNPRKKNPDLLPLVVYGRLAFIEVKNIHYESELMEIQNSKRGAPKEHHIDDVLIKAEEKLSENNSAYFNIHQFYSGEEVNSLFERIDGEAKNNFVGIDVNFIHRPPNAKMFWGAGFDYSSISSDNISFNSFMINPTFGYTPIKNPLFLLDLFFSMDFSLNAQIKLKNNTSNESTPFFYGPQLSTRIVFFPNQRYHLTGMLGYKSYKVVNIESLPDINDQPMDGVTKVSGLSMAIGFAMEI